jgi:16S rRNA (uracil1498-N3)-methyltransferase
MIWEMELQLPRFVMDPFTDGKILTLSEDEAHHALVVMRLRPGDQFIAIDGKGSEYLCNLTEIVEGKAVGEIVRSMRFSNEPSVNLTLVMGLPRPAKMDLIVQKATELGTHRIIPFISEYSAFQLDPSELKGKVDRWTRIAAEATKQSLRSVIPKIANPVKFSDLDAVISQVDVAVLFTPQGDPQVLGELFKSKISPPKEVVAIIGCESGLSREEEEKLLLLGARPCRLGSRRLRTETAAIVAISLILYELGEMV